MTIPAAVEIDIGDDNTVTVKGPKGALSQRLQPGMQIAAGQRHDRWSSGRTTSESTGRCMG